MSPTKMIDFDKTSNVLFICHSGVNRSRTAAEIFKHKYNTKYAGIFPYSNYTVHNKDLKKDLDWADIIVVMKLWMVSEIRKHYGEEYKHKMINLNINDDFAYMEPALITIIKKSFN